MNPWAEPGPMEKLLDHRRRMLSVAALVLACHLPFDYLLYRSGRLLAARLGWLAVVLACRSQQRPGRPRRADAAVVAATAASGLAVLTTVYLEGGSFTPRFGSLLALPLLVLVLAPELPSSAAVTGLFTGFGGALILRHDRGAQAQLAEWAVVSTAMSALAICGSVLFRRLWAYELARERQRAELAVALAESERLAQVGRLAAAVAHEVNNPLAAVKSGVNWLAGRLSSEPELADVFADVQTGVDRIARAVHDLQRAAAPPEPPRQPPPGPPRERR